MSDKLFCPHCINTDQQHPIWMTHPTSPCAAPPVATHLPASVSEVTRQPSAATVEVGCAGTTDTPNV